MEFVITATRVAGVLPPAARFIALAALLLLAGSASAAAATVDEDGVPLNVYMTGAEVRIDRPIEGDLVAAAGRIHVDQPIAGDAVLGAGSLDIQAPVGEDLRAAGAIVTVASRVRHEALIVAARILLTSGADIHGETWLAASSATLGGRLLSAAKVYAREIVLSGEFYGPLELSADRIEIREGARIYGDITYSGAKSITIHPLAQITGKVTRNPGKLELHEPAANIPGLKPLRPLLIAALFAAGVLLHALFPRFTANAVRTLGAAPGRSLGLGTALFFSIPPVALLLVITIIGIPIGLALVLTHAVALLVGYLVATYFLAFRLAHAIGRFALHGWLRYAFFATALVLVALLTSIPYAGVVLLLLAVCAGLGAVVLQRFSRHPASARSATDTWPAA